MLRDEDREHIYMLSSEFFYDHFFSKTSIRKKVQLLHACLDLKQAVCVASCSELVSLWSSFVEIFSLQLCGVFCSWKKLFLLLLFFF